MRTYVCEMLLTVLFLTLNDEKMGSNKLVLQERNGFVHVFPTLWFSLFLSLSLSLSHSSSVVSSIRLRERERV